MVWLKNRVYYFHEIAKVSNPLRDPLSRMCWTFFKLLRQNNYYFRLSAVRSIKNIRFVMNSVAETEEADVASTAHNWHNTCLRLSATSANCPRHGRRLQEKILSANHLNFPSGCFHCSAVCLFLKKCQTQASLVEELYPCGRTNCPRCLPNRLKALWPRVTVDTWHFAESKV